MYTLRDYQQEAVSTGLEFFREPSQSRTDGIIVAPTGSGKSLIIASIAKELGSGVLVLQPSKELLEQNHEKFTAYDGEASIFSASVGVKEIGDTTFATIGSIKSLPHEFDHVRYVLIDECHLVPPNASSMFVSFLRKLSGVKVLGLTASPFRLKKYNDPFTGVAYSQLNLLMRERPRFFTNFLHITQISEMYARGYLSPVKYIELAFDGKDLKVNSTGAEYTEQSMDYALRDQKVHERLPGIIQQSIDEGRRHRLVFVKNVADAERLAAQVPKSACVSAQTKKKDRERILKDFRRGEILTVFNVGVLTVGFDFPALDTIIIARPTMSLALYMQMIGRGVRLSQGKLDCAVVDMCGNFRKFGKMEDIQYVQDAKGQWIISDGYRQLSGVRLDELESVIR